MKIIIAGAGIGGMVAAEKLSKLGFEVTVYEKSPSLNDMRYDWHDDVSPKVFRRLGMEIPTEHFLKRSWTFCSPFEKEIREFQQDETDPDLSIERRPLNEMLYNRAVKSGAAFVFGVTVEAPIIIDGSVKGAIIDGKEIHADLLVDSLGALSPLRAKLPDEFGIQQMPKENELFTAYRAFYSRKVGSPDPKYTNKVYMKHLGEPGISWSIIDNDPSLVNVLIGRVGKMTAETVRLALQDLKKNNPIIGDEIIRGGYMTTIPVRYPITKMVASGYALIGDAAFLTIPLLGSGIASSMLAGDFLGEAVGKRLSNGIKSDKLFTAASLWKYQVMCYREFAEHCGIDILKRWMLSLDDELVNWLFGSKVLTNDDLRKVASGHLVKITPKMALKKVFAVGPKKIYLLLKMNNMLSKCNKAQRIGKNIPRVYNEQAIKSWQKRLSRLYK